MELIIVLALAALAVTVIVAAASTADRFDIAKQLGPVYIEYDVAASTTLYQGTLVCTDGSGNLVQASDTASLLFAGMAQQAVDNSGGAAGAKTCRVEPPQNLGVLELDAVSPAKTWLGLLVYFSDDHTVALKATTTNDIVVGRVIRVPNTAAAGKVWVDTTDRSLRDT